MASYINRGTSKKPSWQYKISRMVNGKSDPIRKGGFRTKKEAQVAAADIEANLAKGVLPHLKPIQFASYFENWRKLYRSQLEPTTIKNYNYTLKAIKEFFKDEAIQEIKRDDYQAFLNEFGEGKSKESVTKVDAHIRACVSYAFEDDIILKNFTRHTMIRFTIEAKKAEEKHLNYEDSKKLIAEVYNRLDDGLGYYIILLGIMTGCRFGELVGLTRKDFKFKENTIDINKTWGYLKDHKKGFGKTKNTNSVRIIKVDKQTMEVFEDLFEKMPTNLHQLVFYSTQSKYNVISNANANKLLKKILNELKIDPITFHGLRHTHASILLYKKISIYYVSERLGHQNIDTTLKAYAHIVKELRTEDEEKTIQFLTEWQAI